MQTQILKCYKSFNILYSQSIFNKMMRKNVVQTIELRDLMFHHSTDKYYIFWTGKKYIKLLKKNIVEIKEN